MKYELFCQNSTTGTVYDITTLGGGISYQTTLGGQPGKLTFTVMEDPNGILQMVCGSIIIFNVDDVGIFYGYIFTMETSADGQYKITAFDQMRYLKNKQIYITSGMTASQVFELVCKDNLPQSKYQIVTPSTYIAPEYRHSDKTLYDIIQYGIDRANISEAGKHYFIKDKFGTLVFTELGQEKIPIIIGDGSLLTDYQYQISIDKNTYNSIILYQNNEETGKRIPWMVQDSSTQKQWGKLQMVKTEDASLNEAQLIELGKQYLKHYNRESKTLKLSAIGRPALPVGTPELVAGSGFTFSLDRLGIKQDMWIISATHNYEKDYHTMDLEVLI